MNKISCVSLIAFASITTHASAGHNGWHFGGNLQADLKRSSAADKITPSHIIEHTDQTFESVNALFRDSRLTFKKDDEKTNDTFSVAEIDFRERTDPTKVIPRLRHLLYRAGSVSIGYSWSTFADIRANPYTLDREGASNAVSYSRRELARYTGSNWSFSLERNRINYLTNSDTEPYNAGKLNKKIGDIPDFGMKYQRQGDFYYISTAAIVRPIDINNHQTFGYGMALRGKLNTRFGEFKAGVTSGKAIGSMLGDSTYADVYIRDGQLNTLFSVHGYVSNTYTINDRLKSNVTASYMDVDLSQQPLAQTQAVNSAHSIHANLVYAYTENMNIGTEYTSHRFNYQTGESAVSSSFNLSLMYSF